MATFRGLTIAARDYAGAASAMSQDISPTLSFVPPELAQYDLLVQQQQAQVQAQFQAQELQQRPQQQSGLTQSMRPTPPDIRSGTVIDVASSPNVFVKYASAMHTPPSVAAMPPKRGRPRGE